MEATITSSSSVLDNSSTKPPMACQEFILFTKNRILGFFIVNYLVFFEIEFNTILLETKDEFISARLFNGSNFSLTA